MEKFLRRLKFYGIGFGLGLVFVFFFFKNRGCSWMPSDRVKNSILDRVIVVSEETQKQMKRRGITNEDLVDALDDGDVYFSDSDKNGESKVYVVESKGVKFAYTLPYESFVSQVFIASKGKEVETDEEGFGEIIHYPNDSTLIYPDSTQMMTCKLERLGLMQPKHFLKRLEESASIDFEKTDLSIRPKPEHYLKFKVDTLDVGARVIWYKNKLNILDLDFEGDESCE